MKILAPAKLNLCVDVLRKSSDGYHEMRTVFHEHKKQSDKIEIFETQGKDSLSTLQPPTEPEIETEENLAFKALKLVKKTLKINKNIQLHIQKNIPQSAGLGGASSDAAAVLKGLNQLWNLKLSTNELQKLGAQLGMDVPFFILGGTAIGTHYGEVITPLKEIANIDFKILEKTSWPPLPISTSEKTTSMYEALDLTLCTKSVNKTAALLKAIENEDGENIIKNLHNDFETLYALQDRLHISGSGPATFTAEIIR